MDHKLQHRFKMVKKLVARKADKKRIERAMNAYYKLEKEMKAE